MNLLDSVYDVHLIKGDQCDSLATYYYTFDQHVKVYEAAGYYVNTPEFCDLYMKEMEEKICRVHPFISRCKHGRMRIIGNQQQGGNLHQEKQAKRPVSY